jgi:hypothetical protein
MAGDWRASRWKRTQVAAIAGLGYPIIAALGGTLRWRVSGLEHLDAIRAAGHQPVMGFWHGRILTATYYFRRRGIVVITSENFDGEWIRAHHRALRLRHGARLDVERRQAGAPAARARDEGRPAGRIHARRSPGSGPRGAAGRRLARDRRPAIRCCRSTSRPRGVDGAQLGPHARSPSRSAPSALRWGSRSTSSRMPPPTASKPRGLNSNGVWPRWKPTQKRCCPEPPDRRILLAMSRLAKAVPVVFLIAAVAVVAQSPRTTLDIYLIDVEGGNATLFVAPSGESLLIDTGNGGAAAERDGGRILAAAKDAGVTQLDHLITTHWHGDHFGAMEVVASKLPDQALHRPRRQRGAAAPGNAFVREGYPALYAKATHTVAKPGDKVTSPGSTGESSPPAGSTSRRHFRGRESPTPRAPTTKAGTPDPGENAQSVGSVVTFGSSGSCTWAT